VLVGNISTGQAAPAPAPSVGDTQRWKQLRKPENNSVRRVSDEAMAWLERLSSTLRPMQTCQRYPHVVNGLAQRWRDRADLTEYFEDLLNTNRGGTRRQRAGFPPPVKDELERLRAHAKADGRLL
jgi:hypothetical protein